VCPSFLSGFGWLNGKVRIFRPPESKHLCDFGKRPPEILLDGRDQERADHQKSKTTISRLSRGVFQNILGKVDMEERSALKSEIKKMLIDNCMLQIPPDEIEDNQALFGPDSLGLDSVDALQLVVALDKNYGLKIADPEAAKTILHSIDSMTEAVLKRKAA
jgi:acyl carrier protein